MKSSLTLATFLLALAATSAYALPPIPGLAAEAFKDSANYPEAFVKEFSGMKSKCDLCHKPGADKKAKGHGLNDYGHAVHDSLSFKEFKALAPKAKEDKEAAAALQKLLSAGLLKAGGMKNEAGQTFAELIKAGKLPGKN